MTTILFFNLNNKEYIIKIKCTIQIKYTIEIIHNL